MKEFSQKIYEVFKYVYNFQKFQTTRSFGDNIYNCKITINGADQKEDSLLNTILDFNNKSTEKSKANKDKKGKLMKVSMVFMKGEN